MADPIDWHLAYDIAYAIHHPCARTAPGTIAAPYCSSCDGAASWFVEQRRAPKVHELVAMAATFHRSIDAELRGRGARVRIIDAIYDEATGEWIVPRN